MQRRSEKREPEGGNCEERTEKGPTGTTSSNKFVFICSVDSGDSLKLRADVHKLEEEKASLQTQIRQLETENKKHLEEINELLKRNNNEEQQQQINDLTHKLKQAAEQIKALQAEKLKLEGYLRTAKNVRIDLVVCGLLLYMCVLRVQRLHRFQLYFCGARLCCV